MGLLRLMLALAVVTVHTGFKQEQFVGGQAAVQLFFMISGFYMGLILTEKYTGPRRYKLFLTNRALRLYPAYFAVCGGALVAWAVCGKLTGDYGPIGIIHLGVRRPALVVLLLVQVTLIGQEVFVYGHRTHGGWLAPTAHYQQYHPSLWWYQVVPPAWSLSLELTFYLLAPFLTRLATRTLVAVAVASLAVRTAIYLGAGLTEDPWTYRFFPSELMFFVAGVLAYRAYRAAGVRRPSLPSLTAITVATLALVIVYPLLPGDTKRHGFVPKQWATYAVVWAALPYLFLWSNPLGERLRWLRRSDRWIGELSYPTYLIHWPVLRIVNHIPAIHDRSVAVTAVTVVVTLALSVLVLRLVVWPIESVRHARVASARGRTVEHAADVVTP